ncbi:M23 family metallopeptidase [Allohahella marinimesophila]|uniref:M23 family metallopeptidase n=2 Tax=Allohahella marinimesophila TaxID=1054972 RepID=A0ABP7NEY7_9GAMM
MRMDSHTSKTAAVSSRDLRRWIILGTAFIAALCLLSFTVGQRLGENAVISSQNAVLEQQVVQNWRQTLEDQATAIEATRQQYSQQMDMLTLRLGELQSRLLRLDALGQRLTSMSELPEGEFDFDSLPSVGGPEDIVAPESFNLADLDSALSRLELQAESRQQQLGVMSDVLVYDKIARQQVLAGKPVRTGWLSSQYGFRSDPFTGKRAWHNGLDFAGQDGSDIIAVAGGVVIFAGSRYGYGNTVEIAHGDGLVTRYAHCKEILVSVGDVVQADQTVALLGSSGRSTGPHVHFEVLQDGKGVSPQKYVQRASR